MFHTFKRLILLVMASMLLASCAVKKPPPPVYIPPPGLPEKRMTLNHTVAPGETLWRISKVYDVPVAAIESKNRLKSSDALKMGQHLVIPDAKKPEQVISLFPSDKWEYIIIHHSATEVGNSLAFNNAHLARGWEGGVGYHFVINNGGGEKADGFVEVTPRWLKQQDGAHCHADGMNVKAIGICLVGNFNKDRVSRKQMESLVSLVNKLRRYYKIPLKKIMRHGKVHGATTECPGVDFPWEKFESKLVED